MPAASWRVAAAAIRAVPNGRVVVEMAAPRKNDDWWEGVQKHREERMRFEVLHMLYGAADRCADFPVEVGGFVRKLGVWQDELERVLRYLVEKEYIHLIGELPRTVCLTVKGVDYIERDCFRRRSIRD